MFAAKIESLELEEKQWIAYVEYLWQYDPYQAQQWQEWFEQRYLR